MSLIDRLPFECLYSILRYVEDPRVSRVSKKFYYVIYQWNHQAYFREFFKEYAQQHYLSLFSIRAVSISQEPNETIKIIYSSIMARAAKLPKSIFMDQSGIAPLNLRYLESLAMAISIQVQDAVDIFREIARQSPSALTFLNSEAFKNMDLITKADAIELWIKENYADFHDIHLDLSFRKLTFLPSWLDQLSCVSFISISPVLLPFLPKEICVLFNL